MKYRLLLISLLMAVGVLARTGKSKAHLDYIEKYHRIAIQEMKTFGIPASITLAQGLLESAAGQSYLAVEGNNHFGIKCHLDWDGKRLYRDDDEKNECFRGYAKAEDSFRDHSMFLKNRSRYAFLFEESPTDYKAWAKGLKKAGYATDRRYPQRLIELIERYELHKYDIGDYVERPGDAVASSKPEVNKVDVNKAYEVQESQNYVKFVVAKKGDTFEQISKKLRVSVKRLLKYNELEEIPQIKGGEILYIQPKRRKAHRDFDTYVVQEGDTAYGIAQKFGIKLKYLYKRNEDLAEGEEPRVGQVLELR